MEASPSTRDVEDVILNNSEKQDVEASSDSDVKRTSSIGEAPDGGAKAWSVVAGASFILFSSLGFSNSFGVFEEYFLVHQLADRTPDAVAWIGSMSVFLQLFLGVLSGPLFDRYGSIVIRLAVVLYIFALMMISICKTYWQFMLAQGVLVGICQGFLTIPAMAAVSQYFDKKRAAALGLSVAGSSIGGVVFPLVLSRMLNSSTLGFGWSVRVVAFMNVPFLIFAGLAITPRVPSRKSAFLIPSAFQSRTYCLLIISLFLTFFGMFMPLFYLPSYAVTKGMSPTLASYLLAILNASSTFGRIIPGIMADKLGKLNVFAAAGIVTGIIAFCFTKAESNAGLIVYSIFIGFSSGTIVSGCAAAFTICLDDPRQLGTYLGMAMSLASISPLIGGPVDGAFLRTYGGFWEMSIFTAVVSIAGGFVTILAKSTRPEGIFGRV